MSSSNNNNRLVVIAAAAVATSSLVTAIGFWAWHQRQIKDVAEKWDIKRQEERRGRIKAEVKLRKALLKGGGGQSSSYSDNTNNVANDDDNHDMKLSTIGTVVSPYTKRMGTPRQGALVPSSRGYIQFNTTLNAEAVDGIQDYSHIWVIFGFHANTSLATSKKSKIRPPRGGGIKVGQLSTRSPHRPNDLGLSLVVLDKWDKSNRRLHISALDLVNGTPVYDIKPYVHWDIPGGGIDDVDNIIKIKVPSWVESRNDVLPNVEFQPNATTALLDHIKANRLAPLYSKKDLEGSFKAAKQTLMEILAQDPRSSHKGLTKNQRGSLSNSGESYKIIFASVEVEFIVKETGAYVIDIHPWLPPPPPPNEEGTASEQESSTTTNYANNNNNNSNSKKSDEEIWC